MSVNEIGSLNAQIVLFINNQPQHLPENLACVEDINIPLVIKDNGNHWRKIFTIFAKLCSEDDWQTYRDTLLLKSNEKICFTRNIDQHAKIQIFAGKQCWQRFVTDEQLDSMQTTACKKVFYCCIKGQWFFYTPYFDYRPFPNVLIEKMKVIMSNCA